MNKNYTGGQVPELLDSAAFCEKNAESSKETITGIIKKPAQIRWGMIEENLRLAN